MEASAAGVVIARSPGEIAHVAARAAEADAVAVDVEANGLFVYRARLCTVQLAWREAGSMAVAILDAIGADLAPLAPLLGPGGPVKVLHDLTFDARMLAEAGVVLGRVRDTSVTARMLGHEATGLVALLASELEVTVSKAFQLHDWAERPLAPPHLEYLAGDVRSLLDLEERLAARAAALDIADEVADECDYKLAAALGPPRDARPAYVRVKGALELDPVARAAMRRLVAARELIAAADDVPPFKVIGNDALLELSRRRPRTGSGLSAIRGATVGRAAGHGRAWLEAIAEGERDGDVPPDERAWFERPVVDRALIAARRARETQLGAWRRAEAKRRGFHEQVVLPGHVLADLVGVLVSAPADEGELRLRIAAVAGLGARRLERYGDALVALARTLPRGALPEASGAPPVTPAEEP